MEKGCDFLQSVFLTTLFIGEKGRGSHSPYKRSEKVNREGHHAWEAGIHDPLSTKIEELILAVTATNVFDQKNN